MERTAIQTRLAPVAPLRRGGERTRISPKCCCCMQGKAVFVLRWDERDGQWGEGDGHEMGWAKVLRVVCVCVCVSVYVSGMT